MSDVAALHWRTKDMAGQRFGRLLVVEPAQAAGRRGQRWIVTCDCGTSFSVAGASLRNGETQSCGCLQRDRSRGAGDRTRTHGLSRTSTYSIWDSMVQRCTNPNRKDYGRYGGAGVTVCSRWLSFDNFLADMGERPAELTIDRKRGDLGYSPENCRWATRQAQARNQSNNRLLTHAGRTQCVAAWAEELGFNQVSVHARLLRGWSVDRALTTPMRKVA